MTPNFVQVAIALFFVWIGLKLVEWFAPQWAKWYIILIALSIIIYWRKQFLTLLDALQGQIGGTGNKK